MRIKPTYLLSFAFLSSGFWLLAFPSQALAQGPQTWTGVCVESGVATIMGLQCLIANVLSVAITGIGLAAFAVFIVASFRYMLSGGNTKAIENSRNALTYAIVGIVVALSAFIILNLISAFTGVSTITRFVLSTNPQQTPTFDDPNIDSRGAFGR